MDKIVTLTEEQIAKIRAWAREESGGQLEACERDRETLLSALEAAQSANRPRDDYPVFCSDCGRAHVLDTVLPSEIWNKIASPDDLLCVVCIDARLKKAGLTAEAEFYYSGDALRSRLYGDADALEAAEARLAEALKALRGLLEPFEGDDCRYDHHGYCQAHFLQEGDECCVEIARRVCEGGGGETNE